MAPPTPSEPTALELHIMVGRNGTGTAWLCEHNDQTCFIRLPQDKSTTEALSLRHLDVLDAPNPNHGLLHIATPFSTVTFDKLLQLFIVAYGNTFEAKGFDLSKDKIRGIFLNYTDKKGQRLASTMYTPSQSIRNSGVFRSTSLEGNPLPCTCGCNRSHHGPSIILILDSNSWVLRKKDASEESTVSYSMVYKDDPMAKIKAFPASVFVPLLVQQEKALAAQTTEKKIAMEYFEDGEKENTKLNEKIETLTKEMQRLSVDNKDLEGRIELLTQQLDSQVETAPVEKLDKDKELLQAEVQKLKVEVQEPGAKYHNSQVFRKVENKAKAVIQGKKDKLEVKNEALVTKNKTSEVKSEAFKKALENLQKQVATAKSISNATEQARSKELGDLRSRVQLLEAQNRHGAAAKQNLTTLYNDLHRRIRRVALNDFTAAKERSVINQRLRNVQGYLDNAKYDLVLQEVRGLLQQMSRFPIHSTVQEFQVHLDDVLSNSAYSNPIRVIGGLHSNSERNTKKRKIDEGNDN